MAVLSVDGSVADRELAPPDFSFGSGWDWSPDGASVVTSLPTGDAVIDLASDTMKTYLSWFNADWQRVAP